MCGIFFTSIKGFPANTSNSANHRGPDNTVYDIIDSNTFIFNRLAINGKEDSSEQPFKMHNAVLMCNGEIYNHTYLWKLIGKTPSTGSDCEIILELYRKFGMEYTLKIIDGVFSIILYDRITSALYVARDPFGVRPLYQSRDDTFSSEIKQINGMKRVTQFTPGTYSMICNNNRVDVRYFTQSIVSNPVTPNIYDSLMNSVTKRVYNTQREVGCLLSGGLDSSVISAMATMILGKPIKTFSIGLEGSPDIINARIVAKWIKSDHHEVIVSEQEMLDCIPTVIKVIESYDTTTVRASVGNYLIGKYISENTNCKVILNGDGADEVMGGYVYMNKSPSVLDFDKECRRLLRDIHHFDVLRSDKCISSNGLEPRTPYLDKCFVQDYLSIPVDKRFTPSQEKQLFRNVIYESNPDLLPFSILYRKKEAFSDGVSKDDRSFYKVIQESLSDRIFVAVLFHNIPSTKEQYYYRIIFDNEYPGHDNILPYFWMPKYVNATDPSARSIKLVGQDST